MSAGTIDLILLWGQDCVLAVSHGRRSPRLGAVLAAEGWPRTAAAAAASAVAGARGAEPVRVAVDGGPLSVVVAQSRAPLPSIGRGELDVWHHGWTVLSAVVHSWLLAIVWLVPGFGGELVTLDELLALERLRVEARTDLEVAAGSGPPSLFSPVVHAGRSAADEIEPAPSDAPTGSAERARPGERSRSEAAVPRAAGTGELSGALGALARLGAVGAATPSPFAAGAADSGGGLADLLADDGGTDLGLRGVGRGSGGSGSGISAIDVARGGIGSGAALAGGFYGGGSGGFEGRCEPPDVCSVPSILGGEADVRGALSREVIRRTVRRHLPEIRRCYEAELVARPDLSGRVTVLFTIAPDGAVASATLDSSTLGNARAETCIVEAVRRWRFPAPDGGGSAAVRYPFVLSPTE